MLFIRDIQEIFDRYIIDIGNSRYQHYIFKINLFFNVNNKLMRFLKNLCLYAFDQRYIGDISKIHQQYQKILDIKTYIFKIKLFHRITNRREFF